MENVSFMSRGNLWTYVNSVYFYSLEERIS